MRSISIAILIIAAFLVSSCSLKPGVKTQGGNNQNQNVPKEKFSLKNALTLGQSLKCTYDENGSTVTTIIKGNKYKVSGAVITDDKGKGGVVSDGDYIYSWDDTTKQGAKFSIKAAEDLEKDAESSDNQKPETFDFEEWANETEGKHNVDCQPTLVTDAEFVPPTDIKFQDMTEFFKQMGEFSEQLQTNPGSTPSTADLEKMGEFFKSSGLGTDIPTEEPASEE